MKKLMTALSAAAIAFFTQGVAHGDAINQGADFEAYTAGATLDTTKADDGTGDTDRYWYSTSNDGLVISNYVGETLPTAPDLFASAAENDNYLSLDTSAPLFRSAAVNAQSTAFTGVEIPADGAIYLDTLVKFTAADEVFGETAMEDGVDKIAIEYVEQGDDVENPITNFVIRAGYIGASGVEQTNYLAEVPANFDKDAWHRLTVRTLPNIGGNYVGFVVYVDQEPLTYSTSVACGVNFTATGLAADLYNDEIHAVYPSAVATGVNKTTIAAASFSGSGCLDDVVFTTTKPDFIVVNTKVKVTWDAHVTALTVNNETVDLTDEYVEVEPVGGVVTVAATFAEGYVYGACNTDGNGAWNATSKEFTNLTPGETCSIVGMKPVFEVNGVYFDNIEDAAFIAALKAGTAASPATLTLLGNDIIALPISVSEGVIVIDLNGKTISGDGTEGGAIVNNGATITVINSAETLGHVAPGESEAAIVIGGGSTTITAGSIDGLVYVDADDYTLSIIGGRFYDNNYDEDGDTSTFYLKDFVTGATTYANSYYQIGEEPTTYAVSYNEPANATVVTDPVGVTALEAGATVTFTVTPATGYKYAAAPTGWTLDNGAITREYTVVAGENTVTIEAPTAIDYVAEIGANKYETLAEAVAAATDGATVKLLKNVTLDARVEPNLGANTALTIDLGGYTITRTGTDGNGSVFDVKSGNVVITNGVIDCTQDDTAIVANGVYAITARSGADVTLGTLTITVDSQAGACVYPFNGAKVTIKSGLYKNLTADAYQYHANWTGMAVNQANVATQLIFIEGGSYYKVDPSIGDDSELCKSFLADGYESNYDETTGYYVVTKSQEKTYPSYIDTDNTELQGKYDTWAKANNVTGADFADNAYVAAFLLNVAPDAADKTLKTASITVENGKVVITANQDLGKVNGKVYVKKGATLAAFKAAEWAEATLDLNGNVQVTPGENEDAGFYQIKVDF